MTNDMTFYFIFKILLSTLFSKYFSYNIESIFSTNSNNTYP